MSQNISIETHVLLDHQQQQCQMVLCVRVIDTGWQCYIAAWHAQICKSSVAVCIR